jgi:hypothetical protein
MKSKDITFTFNCPWDVAVELEPRATVLFLD